MSEVELEKALRRIYDDNCMHVNTPFTLVRPMLEKCYYFGYSKCYDVHGVPHGESLGPGDLT